MKKFGFRVRVTAALGLVQQHLQKVVAAMFTMHHNAIDNIAMHKAADTGDVASVERLLAGGVSVNEIALYSSDSCTPLHSASKKGKAEVVSLLLQNGARINGTDKYEETALHKASNRGQLACVRTLLASGARIDLKNMSGSTALHQACQVASSQHTNIVEALLQHGGKR